MRYYMIDQKRGLVAREQERQNKRYAGALVFVLIVVVFSDQIVSLIC